MAKDPKPQPQKKDHAPTKNRKGGAKVRKLLPNRRLNSTLDRFSEVSNIRTEIRHKAEEGIKTLMANGEISPMDGKDFQAAIHKCKVAKPDPKKIMRLLMPNASF
jgi:hypothetical protein